MLNPPIPPIPGAVGIDNHALRGAVGKVVPVAVATTGAVRVAVGFAAAWGHFGITFSRRTVVVSKIISISFGHMSVTSTFSTPAIT